VRRLLIALVLAASVSVAAKAQPPAPASPPADTAGAGGFSVRRLPGRVGVDGRTWLDANVHVGHPPLFRPGGADYDLRFTSPDDDGDFERWAVMLERPGARAVSLTAGGKTGFVYVSADARYVFMEPLIVVDVKAWRRYALYAELAIQPYVNILASSPDGHRLLLQRSECAMDCSRRTGEEYFELTLPDGRR
jgi:hypothetical protein